MLDEMTLQNASKIFIILEYEHPRSFFHFVLLYFSLMNVLVYVDILGEKIKLHEMKNEKTTYVGFCIPKICQIMFHFAGSFHEA